MNPPDKLNAREFKSFTITDKETFKQQMLNWVNQFNICCFLDNQQYNLPYHSYDCIVAAGALYTYQAGNDLFASLSQFYTTTDDWIFGHFNYDLKNKIEKLISSHPDRIGFPDAFLFVPQVVILLHGSTLSIGAISFTPEDVFNQISASEIPAGASEPVHVTARTHKEKYLKTISTLKDHIRRGDCYEINYCQEFFVENCLVHPLPLYTKLTTVSPNPFSAYYKINGKHLLCASPERYLKKEGNRIISQPIKGTNKRMLNNKEADEAQRQKLFVSDKERSENVMVVDLVRNDLSKICREGSVKVKELFGIYSFPQVHQMISTIEGELEENTDLSAILRATYPMGSMTGAPKKRVMELIDRYEETKRGIYSGTVGYITPAKDFDFNVVIRSIMYDNDSRYLSYQVGSAITYNSDPEKEYEECLLKADAIKNALQ